MSCASFLLAYFTLNALIIAAFGGLKLGQNKTMLAWRTQLRLHYTLITGVMLLTFLHPVAKIFLPSTIWFEPPVKAWSASSFKNFSREIELPQNAAGLLKIKKQTFRISQFAPPALALPLFFLLVSLGYLVVSLRKLRRMVTDSNLVRRLGSVRVLTSDQIYVPISFWWPTFAAVVIPESMIASHPDFKIALSHELQHHRQRDTQWAYLFSTLRYFCFLNPAVHWWTRWINELQEFACDETLVDRKKVESRQYIRCLIEVAESSLYQKEKLASAAGLSFLVEQSLLKRRIEAMFQNNRSRRTGVAVPAFLLLALLTMTAVATQGVFQDRRVSKEEAMKWAEVARKDSAFPIVVNDLVLRQLNRLLGTAEGREFVKQSLARMENYRPFLDDKMKEYSVPLELLAIPSVESGYQNLAPNNKVGWGAGLWMFLKNTARHYNLRVDAEVDERLDVKKLTDAAMRLLKSDYYRFQDWPLAVLAYNVGENAVQAAIQKTGSRDAWVLIREGFENDKDYLAQVMATIIIMKNPEVFS